MLIELVEKETNKKVLVNIPKVLHLIEDDGGTKVQNDTGNLIVVETIEQIKKKIERNMVVRY